MELSHDSNGADPHHDNGAVYLINLRDVKEAHMDSDPVTVTSNPHSHVAHL